MTYAKKFLFCSVVGVLVSCSMGMAMNLLLPYQETLIRPPFKDGDRLNFHVFVEHGVGTRSFNSEGPVCSSLRIWQTTFNSLAMLKGFLAGSAETQLLNIIGANNNEIRGHFAVTGQIETPAAAAFCGRWFFHRDWFLSAFLPVYSMELKDFSLTDLTKAENAADLRIKNLLTNNIFGNIKKLDPSLELSDWKRAGLGDFAFFVNWFRDFPQAKELLQNVRLNWRLGLSIPTGKRWDEDKIMALPFGYDGAFAIPYGFGLDLTYRMYVRAGFDVELTQIFGDTRNRRIKTSIDQSEIILLQKAAAYKDFGLTQRFNLYAQLDKFYKGFSFLLSYQFLKHGRDTLSLRSNTFSSAIANTAQSLQDFTMHEIILNASYDFNDTDLRTRPYFALYARLPFNGKRSTLNKMIGFTIGLDYF